MSEHDETEVEEQVDEQNPEGQEEEQDWTPPARADWEKLNNTARARKEDIAKLRKELGELKAKTSDGKPDEETQRQRDEQTRELRIKRVAGMAALAGEGLTRAQAKAAVKLLNLDDVELDDDGDGDFDDAIAELKEIFPQLFAKEEAPARRVPKVTTGDRGSASGPARDRTDEKLLRQAGYR